MEIVLRSEAMKFKELYNKFNDEYEKSETMLYFLISLSWLKKWKKYVGYDLITKGLEPNFLNFGLEKDCLSDGNADLIQSTIHDCKEEFYTFHEHSENGSTIILKPNLKEAIDYLIVDLSIVELFENIYPNFRRIPRRAYLTPSGRKRTEIYYK